MPAAPSSLKISIIVPCYKVEKYLPRCLDSLLNQTLDGVEVIAVNDGSPDRCIDILRSYQVRYGDRLVVIDKQNEGVWQGRRDGIALAKGEFIGFVDSDDYVAPDYCEKLYECAIREQADIAVCGFYRIEDETGKKLTTEMAEPREAFNAADEPARLLELNGAPWNKIFRAQLMKELPDLPHPPRIFDDMMMHLLVFPRVERIAFTPHALVYYIIRGNSIMTTISKEQIDSTYRAMLEVGDSYIRQGATPRLMDFLAAAAFLHLGISLMFRISYDKTADLGAVLRENRTYLNTYFPAWKSSAIISLGHALEYKGANLKVWLGRIVYRAHLMRAALSAYRLMIEKTGRDIKW